MNLKRSLTAVPALCAVLLLAACEKDGSTAPASASDKASLLVGKEWIMTSYVSEPGYRDEDGNLVTDLMAERPGSCFDPHPMKFEANGRFPESPASGKCGDDIEPMPGGVWSLKANGTILVMDVDGEIPPIEEEILILTDKTLKLSLDFPAMGDTPARKLIATYTAR